MGQVYEPLADQGFDCFGLEIDSDHDNLSLAVIGKVGYPQMGSLWG